MSATNNRERIAAPRTFEQFPENSVCPICGTNKDGTAVLVAIAGTAEKGMAQAQPMHLACAVVDVWDDGMQMGYTWPKTPDTEPQKPHEWWVVCLQGDGVFLRESKEEAEHLVKNYTDATLHHVREVL